MRLGTRNNTNIAVVERLGLVMAHSSNALFSPGFPVVFRLLRLIPKLDRRLLQFCRSLLRTLIYCRFCAIYYRSIFRRYSISGGRIAVYCCVLIGLWSDGRSLSIFVSWIASSKCLFVAYVVYCDVGYDNIKRCRSRLAVIDSGTSESCYSLKSDHCV